MGEEPSRELRHLLAGTLILAVTWLLWSGHYTGLILALGAGSVALVVWLSARLGLLDEEGAPIHLALGLVTYLPWLLKEIVVANLDVARRIIDPALPIQPQWVVTHGDQRTAIGLVLYANSITLTPGTVTVDVQGHALLVHAVCDVAATGLETDDMNRRCARVEAHPEEDEEVFAGDDPTQEVDGEV